MDDGKALQCVAIDSLGKACMVRIREASKWCPKHDEERKKLYNGYKIHHAALDAFPDEALCKNVKAIQNCLVYDTVKGWSQALRNKFILLNRCIHARAYFTERFFGNDMDFGHKTFWYHLNKKRDEVEDLLINVERRAYELLLASQNAMWVLDRQNSSSKPTGEDCSGHVDEPLSNTPPISQTTPNDDDMDDVDDPVDVALREKCVELWENIRTRLARYCAPYESRYYKERLAIIWAFVSRAVYTDPTLMLVAQNYNSATLMLADLNLDLTTVEKLWTAIKGLYVVELRAAIDDVLEPVRENGEYVVVLGTRVHKGLSGVSPPFHAWGHMTVAFPCYSCIRQVCTTVDEIVALTRYIVLTGSVLAQSYTRYEYEFEECRTLSLCGFVPNGIDDFGPRYKVEKSNCPFDHNKPHWTETKSNNVICVGLSLTDPKTQLFVNACLRHPDLTILCRKGAHGRLIRSRPMRCTQTRNADTRAGLKVAPWNVYETVYFMDSLLEEARPFVGPDEQLDDCFQLAIVDDGEGEVEAFVDKLAKLWYQVYEVEDIIGLLVEIGSPLLEDGELEVETNGKQDRFSLLPNLEPDMMVSYRRLWGKGLLREGQLVYDEPGLQTLVYSKFGKRFGLGMQPS